MFGKRPHKWEYLPFFNVEPFYNGFAFQTVSKVLVTWQENTSKCQTFHILNRRQADIQFSVRINDKQMQIV
jgi:hypothetical protein